MNNEIEVLIMLNIPPDNFINSLSKTALVQSLSVFYNKKPPTTKKNVFYLNHGIFSSIHQFYFVLGNR